jgi:hypothetical protein
MQDVITRLVDVPFARMFVLAGIIFLLVAVLGKVEGKIDPGNMGRIGASVLGVVLLIIGVVLQYIEIRDINLERMAQQARMQSQNTTVQNAMAALVDSAAIKQSGVPATVSAAADKPAIAVKIVSGTYGRSCNAKLGNATQLLAKFCDGKSACDYAVEPVELENAPAGCAKDFAAEWKCGSGSTVYSATLPASAGKNEKLHLACAG